MAPVAADATQMAPSADAAAVGPQLAYSQDEEPGYYEMPADSLEEFVPEQDDEAPYTAVIAPPPRRTLLMGSALAFVVLSFATLAVTVAITIRPAASVEAQPAPTVSVEYGAGPVPAAGTARARSGGAADRGGVAAARGSSRAECPDQSWAGDRQCAVGSAGAGGAAARPSSCATGAGGPDSAGHHSSAVEPVPHADVPDADNHGHDADDYVHNYNDDKHNYNDDKHDNADDDHDNADDDHDNADVRS